MRNRPLIRCVSEYVSNLFYIYRIKFEIVNFKVPRRPNPWNDTFEAFEFGSPCLQKHSGSEHIIGSENCLFLNVYVPDQILSDNENLKFAVMVYIHGGTYQFGSGDVYGPDFLLEQNVIVVSAKFKFYKYSRYKY